MAKEATTLMTEGPIWKRITFFAIPLLWGMLFQQFYNTADSIIVGNFLGDNALAAVSSSINLIFLMIGFFNGIGLGAGIIIAKYFGARDIPKLRRAMHTVITFAVICGCILMVMGLFGAPFMLNLMGTPAEVLPNSLVYFRVYYCGSIGFVLYNFSTGVLQALGDSKHPLYFLIISSITNVILDLVLIAGLGYGVGAAALATIISQFLSALLCLGQLTFRNPPELRLRFSELGIDFKALKEIILIGLPSGLQNCVVSIANVFVQTNVNTFGAVAVAGYGSYVRIEGFAFIPVFCFAQAISTFVGQNLGAKNYSRARKGAYFGVACTIVLAETVGIIVYTFCPKFIAAFGASEASIAYGVIQGRIIALFYGLMAIAHSTAAVMRGAGKAFVPMAIMMGDWCIFRVAYITVILKFIHKINVIYWAYPITWIISAVIFLFFLFKTDWVHGLEK